MTTGLSTSNNAYFNAHCITEDLQKKFIWAAEGLKNETDDTHRAVRQIFQEFGESKSSSNIRTVKVDSIRNYFDPYPFVTLWEKDIQGLLDALSPVPMAVSTIGTLDKIPLFSQYQGKAITYRIVVVLL